MTLTTISWDHLASRMIPVTESGCWLWIGATCNKGYGNVYFQGKTLRVHRVAYELSKGPLPDDLTIDHLCRVRCCINPDHLEAVTNKENTLRGIGPTAINANKKYCKNGHLFDESTIYWFRGDKGNPHRSCRICRILNDDGRKR